MVEKYVDFLFKCQLQLSLISKCIIKETNKRLRPEFESRHECVSHGDVETANLLITLLHSSQ